ncbi:hypothetical protein BN133_719 [Cronobacter dublinensis 582]|nr:hypothetical protein BN133_719 [Cronobacter dublinensis 582]
MERVAFERRTLCRRHHKAVIERGVMGHHNRPVTVALFHALAHHFKNGVQRVIFADGAAQRVMRVDTVKSQRFGLEDRAFERLNVKVQRLIGGEPAIGIHFQRNGGNFQQRIGFRIKTGGFHIDDNRVKATKTVGQTGQLSVIGHQRLLSLGN